jgi:hypothetical protein
MRGAGRVDECGGGMPVYRPAPIDRHESGGAGLYTGRV